MVTRFCLYGIHLMLWDLQFSEIRIGKNSKRLYCLSKNGKITSKRGAEKMKLKILDSTFSIVKIPPTETIPSWATKCDVFSITRTNEELSIVCPSECLPINEELRILKMIGSV